MKILVLGVGNILFGDEGIGVHLCNYLKVNYRFQTQHELDFIDGGTLAQSLIPLITSYDEVLILDCVSVEGASVGEVYHFPFSKVPNIISWAGSAHEVEMLQTLRMIEVMGDLPPVSVIGIVPFVIGEETTFSLSEPLKEGAKVMESLAIDFLSRLGVDSQKTRDIPLQVVAEHSFKGVDAL